jgi:hypothetical protein
MPSTPANREAESDVRRSVAEHAKARDAARKEVADRNEKAHKEQVRRRKVMDRLKADLRKGLEY